MGYKATYFTEILEPHRKTMSNRAIREEAGMPLLTDVIKTKRLRLLGHVMRGNQEQLEHSVCFTDGWNYRRWRKPPTHHRRRQLQNEGNMGDWLHTALTETWEEMRKRRRDEREAEEKRRRRERGWDGWGGEEEA